MSAETLKKALVPKYVVDGENKFYRLLLFWGTTKLMLISKGIYKGKNPNLEFMDYHDRFLALYRQENEDIYLQIAKTLRKAANKLYRIMLKQKMSRSNIRFLNLVK